MAVKMSLEKLIQRGLTAMKFATPLHVFTCSGVANFIAISPRCLICQILSNFSGDKFQRTVSKCNLEKIENWKFKMCLHPPKSMKLGIFTSKKQTSFISCPLQTFYFSYEFLLITRGEFHEIYYFIRCDHLSSFAIFK